MKDASSFTGHLFSKLFLLKSILYDFDSKEREFKKFYCLLRQKSPEASIETLHYVNKVEGTKLSDWLANVCSESVCKSIATFW